MIFSRGNGGVSWIVVGLGNPGKSYESTRHNMGFLAADGLADKEGFTFNKLRFRAWTALWRCGGEQVLVMKPQTYMNLSGEAVGEAARFYKVSPDHVLVISDDISLPAGKLRIRPGENRRGHPPGRGGRHHRLGDEPPLPGGRKGADCGAGQGGGGGALYHRPRPR